jgi:hypothetical protein
VDQLRLLGRHADCAPWQDYRSPKLAFLLFRTETCEKAGKPKR